MTDYIQVTTTTEHREDADRIAQTLVDARLAACVQIEGPITSTYRWKGRVETSPEWRCTAKTRRDLFEQIDRAIREIHPYEVPQILAVPIVAGSQSYLDWLGEELAEKP
jgi:periplasmic divalent cation tolerance protein